MMWNIVYIFEKSKMNAYECIKITVCNDTIRRVEKPKDAEMRLKIIWLRGCDKE